MLVKGTKGEEKAHDSANPSHAQTHHFALLRLGPITLGGGVRITTDPHTMKTKSSQPNP